MFPLRKFIFEMSDCIIRSRETQLTLPFLLFLFVLLLFLELVAPTPIVLCHWNVKVMGSIYLNQPQSTGIFVCKQTHGHFILYPYTITLSGKQLWIVLLWTNSSYYTLTDVWNPTTDLFTQKLDLSDGFVLTSALVSLSGDTARQYAT